MIKQAHVLLDAINDWPRSKNLFWEYSKDKLFTTSPWGWKATVLEVSKCFTHKDGKVYNMFYDEYHQMIYPGWKPGHPQWKQTGRVIHPHHSWLSDEMPAEAKAWFIEYLSVFGKLPEEWAKHRGGLEQGIKRLQNKYYIE